MCYLARKTSVSKVLSKFELGIYPISKVNFLKKSWSDDTGRISLSFRCTETPVIFLKKWKGCSRKKSNNRFLKYGSKYKTGFNLTAQKLNNKTIKNPIKQKTEDKGDLTNFSESTLMVLKFPTKIFFLQ